MSPSERASGCLQEASRRYSSLKYGLTIIETGYVLGLSAAFLGTGLSSRLSGFLLRLIANPYLALCLYLLAAASAYCVLEFPFHFYHSFVLEHRFHLSRQRLKGWFLDQVKGAILSFCLGIIVIEVFFFLVNAYPRAWWWIVSLFWIFFSLILARLAPVVIIPLFFKYEKISDEPLRQRIIALANKMHITILDVYRIDFSKKTAKANAALVGWGKTRRVILADTLADTYSAEEIEVILAHEFGHQKLRHLIKLVIINAATTAASFWCIFISSQWVLERLGLARLGDIASLPAVLVYLVVLGLVLTPLENAASRAFERNADRVALETTGLRQPFISAMEKLAEQNLTDRNPHPVIKFFFFDHPPIEERIAWAHLEHNFLA